VKSFRPHGFSKFYSFEHFIFILSNEIKTCF